jgi:hypothetical protein
MQPLKRLSRKLQEKYSICKYKKKMVVTPQGEDNVAKNHFIPSWDGGPM